MKSLIKASTVTILAIMLAGCGSSGASMTARSTSADGAGYATEEYVTAEDNGTMEDSSVTGDKLVYTGSLSVETLNYTDTITLVREKIKSYDGIIESENEWNSNYKWYSEEDSSYGTRSISFTIRIPTDDFEAFLNDMEGAGQVMSRSSNVENITKSYNDNANEIASLEKQEERLLEMMDEATSVEDLISIDTRLSEVQSELTSKRNYQSSMDTDVEYSTIYLDISEVKEYSETDSNPILKNFGEEIAETVTYSLQYFVYFLQVVLLACIRLLPFAIVVIIVIVIIKQIRKKQGKDTKLFHFKKKEKKEEMK